MKKNLLLFFFMLSFLKSVSSLRVRKNQFTGLSLRSNYNSNFLRKPTLSNMVKSSASKEVSKSAAKSKSAANASQKLNIKGKATPAKASKAKVVTKSSPKKSEDKVEPTAVPDSSPKKKKTFSDGKKVIRDSLKVRATLNDLIEGDFLKVISWNVNGFKALIAKNKQVLLDLVAKYQPHILFLQETKLQESQVENFRDILVDDYTTFWSCCTVKNGYSGTAVFVRKDIIGASLTPSPGESSTTSKTPSGTNGKQKTLAAMWGNDKKGKKGSGKSEMVQSEKSDSKFLVEKISYDFSDEETFFPGEGRTITLECNKMVVTACYVPNSMENLRRLDFRTKEWDAYVSKYLNNISKRKPVIFCGDLNVGHLDLDIHNPNAPHIKKQAGLTPEERNSHSSLLDTNFSDAFRFYYPTARGQFTYWSQRTFARPDNRGLRLDYFVCSKDMFPTLVDECENESIEAENAIEISAKKIVDTSMPTPCVYDSYMLHEDTVGVSDHCPILLVVKI